LPGHLRGPWAEGLCSLGRTRCSGLAVSRPASATPSGPETRAVRRAFQWP